MNQRQTTSSILNMYIRLVIEIVFAGLTVLLVLRVMRHVVFNSAVT